MPGELRADRPAPGVLRLTIDNPAKRGALDDSMLAALAAALADPGDARCVLVTGQGPDFSSGYDLVELHPDEDPFSGHPFERALAALDATDLPTIAALNGATVGGALELALACDLRIAAESARLAMPPARLGVVYSSRGLRRFVAVLGAPRTRELFLLGRPVDAATALAWGLVHELAPHDALEAAALGLAVRLAGGAPLAVAGTKRVLRALESATGPLAPEVEAELRELRLAALRSDDLREGIAAFAQKRTPRWRGR